MPERQIVAATHVTDKVGAANKLRNRKIMRNSRRDFSNNSHRGEYLIQLNTRNEIRRNRYMWRSQVSASIKPAPLEQGVRLVGNAYSLSRYSS